MNSSTTIILIVASAIILIVCIAFLPWLSADPSAYVPPWLEQVIGLVSPISGDGLGDIASIVTGLLGDKIDFQPLETLQVVVGLLENAERIKPIDLFRLDFASLLVKVAVLLPFITAFLSLVTAILIWMQSTEGVQITSLVTAVVGGVAVMLMVIGIPSLLRFGSTDDIGVALAATIFNVRLTYGYWLTLGLTLALIFLSIFTYFFPPISRRSGGRHQNRSYRY